MQRTVDELYAKDNNTELWLFEFTTPPSANVSSGRWHRVPHAFDAELAPLLGDVDTHAVVMGDALVAVVMTQARAFSAALTTNVRERCANCFPRSQYDDVQPFSVLELPLLSAPTTAAVPSFLAAWLVSLSSSPISCARRRARWLDATDAHSWHSWFRADANTSEIEKRFLELVGQLPPTAADDGCASIFHRWAMSDAPLLDIDRTACRERGSRALTSPWSLAVATRAGPHDVGAFVCAARRCTLAASARARPRRMSRSTRTR